MCGKESEFSASLCEPTWPLLHSVLVMEQKGFWGFLRTVPEEAGTDTGECSAGSLWMGKGAVAFLCLLHLRSWWCFFEKNLHHCEPKLHLIESKSPSSFVLHKRVAQSRGNLFRYKCLHEVLESSGAYTHLIELLSSQPALFMKGGQKHLP